ncbi:sensor domain-containing diguanylate cyclase [Sporosarcina aquimarina]|uniref:Sensor domain-containing diguanylate cyclase n=1 Tax=Sporosarcina aquimarina TaxID=114975 RepID=A0ABU4G0H3_9BACL|nr:sensor domain-containing diguanylate cyclase [Sporosarcina aquimarina]MDW0109808.1 sensor domain-containing diguanylate cyclase [Sporosarcina aquimarina]
MRLRDISNTPQKDVLYQLLEESFLVAYLTVDGHFLEVNERFLNVFHYTRADIYGKECTMLLDGQLYNVAGISHSIFQGETWKGETCFITKFSELKYLESTFVPIENAQGEIDKIISFHKDRTEQKNAIRWQQIAFQNEVTHLPNRRRLAEVLNFYAKNVSEFSLFNLDIDHFKRVNDRYGHAVGDQLLFQIGNRLNGLAFIKDCVYHVSGDEFVIVVPITTTVEKIIEEIHNAFETSFMINDFELTVNMSLGYSRYPQDSTDTSELLQLADAAMYTNKLLKRR